MVSGVQVGELEIGDDGWVVGVLVEQSSRVHVELELLEGIFDVACPVRCIVVGAVLGLERLGSEV